MHPLLTSRAARIVIPAAAVTAVAAGAAFATLTSPDPDQVASLSSQNLTLSEPGSAVPTANSSAPSVDAGQTATITGSSPTSVAATTSATTSASASPTMASSTPSKATPSKTTPSKVVSTKVKQVAVPFKTKTTKTSTLAKGKTKIKTVGKKGLANVTYRVTSVNGKVTASTKLETEVVRAPITQEVLVGTAVGSSKPSSTATSKPTSTPTAKPGSTAGGDLNWAALAKCESGGNPKAYNPAGYYGLYQFDLRTWRSVGGTGKPTDASASEQTMRAQMLYKQRGAQPWPVCGRKLFT